MDSSSEDTHEVASSSEEQAEQQEEENLPNGDGVDEQQQEKEPSSEAGNAVPAISGDAGKLFIGGLSWETTTDKLTKHFAKYGEIIDSVVMKDRVTGHPRGFGFVTYSDASVLDTVIEENHILDGRAVDVKRTIPREDSSKGSKTKKIFVGGLTTSVSEDELEKYFQQFGTVVGHQIMKDHASGRSRGFGFVIFENEQEVDNIIAQGKRHELGGKQVEIKKAEPKKPDSEAAVSRMHSLGRGGYAGGYMAGNYGPYGEGMYGGGYHSAAGYGARMGGYAGSSYGYGNAGYAGGMFIGYGESERYGHMGYGSYNSGGYGPTGGRRYGSSASNGRFHPYGRN